MTTDNPAALDPAQSIEAGKPDRGQPVATVRRSAGCALLAAALAKAQGEMSNPPKDSVNPHFKSKYADLATVRDAVIPALSRNGLCVVQMPCELGTDPALVTLLAHSSGEWVESTVRLRVGKSDPQGVGSGLTYLRRYSLQAVAGVAAEADDDGHAASRRDEPRQQQRQEQPRQQQEQPRPAAEVIVEGDPVTDGKAANELAKSKGWVWSQLVHSLNTKFNAKYSPTQTKWLDVKREHRESVVDALRKVAAPKPEPVDTCDTVFAILEQLAKREGCTTARFLPFVGKECDGETYLDNMNPDQLRRAGAWVRAKLAEPTGKAGAK